MNERETRQRLPPGQVLTQKWPVLTYGETPHVDRRTWTFCCFGLVDQEVSWTWEEFVQLPRVVVKSDVHWVRAFEFLDVDAPGFWEVNGYHLRADPWREKRYSDQETHAMQRMRAEAARRLRGR